MVRESLVEFTRRQYPTITIGERYTSDSHPAYFATADSLGFNPQLRFGNNVASVSKDTEMLRAIKNYGLFKKARRFQQDSTFRIAVVDVIQDTESHLQNRNDQLRRFAEFLKTQGFEVKRAADPISIQEQDPIAQRAQLTKALRSLIENKPDIILIYLPVSDSIRSDDDPLSLYNTTKDVCIGAGVPSQVIYEETVWNKWADDNILMGILGKTGNIPYVLAEPLEYTDVIVGFDVSRRIKANAPGTVNTAALSRIYTNQGALLGYAVGGMVVEGEAIPQYVLERILPEVEFRGKRAVIHRDGLFAGDELKSILDWGTQIGAEFLPVEVLKSGVARLYKDNGAIDQTDKGTVFFLSDNTAYLVSSPPPRGKKGPFSTARPLGIVNHSRLPLEQAIHSVIALTLLHYGSVRPPRLPVSTHASDKIAGFLSRNIRPEATRGDVPFWL